MLPLPVKHSLPALLLVAFVVSTARAFAVVSPVSGNRLSDVSSSELFSSASSPQSCPLLDPPSDAEATFEAALG